MRSGEVGAAVFHVVGTGATDGLGAGWDVGRVAVPRMRVRVDPGKKAAAIKAVRAACGEARSYYDEAICSDFVGRLGKGLSKGRDADGRSVKERAAAGLAAISRGAGENEDVKACLKAACRGDCGLFPCLPAKVLRAAVSRAKLSELGGGDVSVSGATVVMPSGGGGRAARAASRQLGKSTRGARDGAEAGSGGEAALDFDFSAMPPAGLSAAERKAEAAAEVNTRAAVARASAQVNGFRQQGWEHMCAAEAAEVTAALAEAIKGGELALHAVNSVQDLQDAVSELLGEVRGTAEGYAREVSVLRENRCKVIAVKFRADGTKRARRSGGAAAQQSSEASDPGDGTALSAADKSKVWEEFLEKAHAVYSRAPTFGFLSAAEASRLCAELANGESTAEGDAPKFEEIVRAGFGQLERAGCAKASYEVSGQTGPSYTLGTEAFLGTVTGQAVVGGA